MVHTDTGGKNRKKKGGGRRGGKKKRKRTEFSRGTLSKKVESVSSTTSAFTTTKQATATRARSGKTETRLISAIPWCWSGNRWKQIGTGDRELYKKINPNAAHKHLSFHKISRFSLSLVESRQEDFYHETHYCH